MRLYLQLRHWTLLILTTVTLCACNNDDDTQEDYGDGTPQASNIIQRKGYQYLYNNNGLIATINRIDPQTDKDGNVTDYKYVKVASFSYPQNNRAVMTNEYGDTYVFAFGSDNFAHRIIETESDGETHLIKLTYDKEGHIIKMDDSSCDIIEMKYTNGNLSYVKDNANDEDSHAEITYTPYTNFDLYNMTPFLLNINLGPFVNELQWWFQGFEHALYAGFLGKPFAKNLPKQIISYDKSNGTQYSDIEYYILPTGEGQYSQDGFIRKD